MSITPQRLKELDDKVREVGTFLGMQFDEEYAQKHERDWNYWSQLKNGNKVISFHAGDYHLKDRWQIRAEFPRDKQRQDNTPYRHKRPEITVSMSKTPEKIAKDIKSRIIPEYERQLEETLINIEKSNKYYAGKLAQISQVAQYLGIDPPTDDNRSSLYLGYEKGVNKIESHSEDKVKFEVETSAEKAIEILKLLGY